MDKTMANLPVHRLFDGQPAVLTGVTPLKDYITKQIKGQTCSVLFPKIGGIILNIKVEGQASVSQQDIDNSSTGVVAVDIVGLSVKFWEDDSKQIHLSAKAADVRPKEDDLLG